MIMAEIMPHICIIFCPWALCTSFVVKLGPLDLVLANENVREKDSPLPVGDN